MSRDRTPAARIYFRVEKNSEAMKKIEEIDKKHHIAVKSAFKLLKELGVPGGWLVDSWNGRSYGFRSNPLQASIDWTREHSDLYRLDKDRTTVPRKTCAEGKAIAAKFKALPPDPDGEDINVAMGMPATMIFGMAIYWCGLHRPKKSQPIVSIPWPAYRENKKNLTKGLTQLSTEEAMTLLDAEKKEDSE